MATDAQQEQGWFNGQFLAQFGLFIGNALAYLSGSTYWDLGSANEIVRQNRQYEGNVKKYLEHADVLCVYFQISLAEDKDGKCYEGEALDAPENQGVQVNPGLVLVEKRKKDGLKDNLLAKYYIMDGTVFESPDLYSILSVNLRRAMLLVHQALREVRNLFEWDLDTGFHKKIESEGKQNLYVLNSNDLQEMGKEIVTEIDLQNRLLDALLSEASLG